MATNQQLLDEARKAYHALQTGTMARVVVDIDGSRVEFAPANLGKLYSYIQELEQKVAAASPNAADLAAKYGPASFTF